MTDIRHRLNVRREQLIEREEADHKTLNAGAATTSRFQTAARNVEELRSIDATLATMQLADAQRELANSQRQVAEAQQEANRQSAKEGADREEVGYWARRFLTNITIANSAAFAAIVLFISKPDSPLMDYEAVRKATMLFFYGMILGGALPLLALLGMFVKSSKSVTYVTNRWPWAKALNSITSKNVLVGMYAALATVMLISGIRITLDTTTSYYESRGALIVPHPTPTNDSRASHDR